MSSRIITPLAPNCCLLLPLSGTTFLPTSETAVLSHSSRLLLKHFSWFLPTLSYSIPFTGIGYCTWFDLDFAADVFTGWLICSYCFVVVCVVFVVDFFNFIGGGGGEGLGRGIEWDMQCIIRLRIVVMFQVKHFEPHTCTVIQWFGALERHLLLLLLLLTQSLQPQRKSPPIHPRPPRPPPLRPPTPLDHRLTTLARTRAKPADEVTSRPPGRRTIETLFNSLGWTLCWCSVITRYLSPRLLKPALQHPRCGQRNATRLLHSFSCPSRCPSSTVCRTCSSTHSFGIGVTKFRGDCGVMWRNLILKSLYSHRDRTDC